VHGNILLSWFGRNVIFRISSTLLLVWSLLGCAGQVGQRVFYDEHGILIGIEHDPTTERETPVAFNSHPAHLTADQVRTLLGMLQVSGYSGTLGGLIATPRPIPLFKEMDLERVSSPLATAFNRAGAQDRVFFSIPDREKPYNEDRTAGSLFIRGPYLHFILTDHSAFLRADTAGSEDLKDPRDTKGMRLWVASPGRAAAIQPEKEPRWGVFEKVHISLDIRETLAARQVLGTSAQKMGNPIGAREAPEAQPQAGSVASARSDSEEDLRLQIRELTRSNLELRARLEEQSRQMAALKKELARIQEELEKAKSPSLRRPLSP